MPPHVRIEQQAARPTAVVRRCVPASQLSRVVPEACGIVWSELRKQQVTGAGCHIAIYFDDQIHLEVGVELLNPFEGSGEVAGSATPAGRVAAATHLGPYGLLHRTHDAIRQWCISHGYSLAGPRWEIYGHWQEAWNQDPAQIRTEVVYLLQE